ncbi:transposase [Salinispora pacifica]|uniref:transposase n=1 Tax=Salinispora pacifica TaxID=351187 RepID=UPI0004B830B6|nr:transposase [Salinispora pacifica]
MFLAYASPAGRTLIDRELYLPRGWCDDPARRAEAGITAKVGFATKPALGLRMIERALTAGLPAKWVTADEAYGQNSKFRIWLQQQRIGYVLAVPRTNGSPPRRAAPCPDALAAAAPALACKRRSCGDGAKGRRLYDWAVAFLPGAGDGYGHWPASLGISLVNVMCFGCSGSSGCVRCQDVSEQRFTSYPSTVDDAPLRAWTRRGSCGQLVLQPGLLTLAELRFDAMRERGQPPSIMDGCVD